MSNNINLIAFGTFGNPNGFKQTFFVGSKDLAKNVKTFDLKTEAIKLFPNSKIYAIRKELVNGNNIIAYAIYTFAKEQHSDRGGTFVGSSLLFANKIADEDITIRYLNSFQKSLVSKNVRNDVIAVNHSDNFSVSKPKDFDNIELHLKEIGDLNFAQSSHKNLVVYSEVTPQKLRQQFKKAIDLLNVYDTIYFTDSREVAEFVHHKGILKLVQNDGYEQEIQNLHEERNRKILVAITEYEKEKQRLEEDRKKIIQEYKEQIERNEKLHQENKKKIDESKVELKTIDQKFDSYVRGVSESINQLKSGRKLEEVKQLHNQNKRVFIENVYEKLPQSHIGNISKPDMRTDLRPESQLGYDSRTINSQHKRRGREDEFRRNDREDFETGISIFKVMSFILFFLWIGTLSYFLFFHNNEKNNDEERGISNVVEANYQETQIPSLEQPVAEVSSVQKLEPYPNSELNTNDCQLVSRKTEKGIIVDDVVRIIFDNNPTDINRHYSDQSKLYAQRLVELNRDCFEERNGVFYFVKDTLKYIPSYKIEE